MPINPNIAMGVNPIQFKQSDPYDQFGKQLQLKKLLAGEQDDQTARAAISSSDGTPKSILAALVKSGNTNPALYSAYQKMVQDADINASQKGLRDSQTAENMAKVEKAAADQHNAQLQHIQSPADLNGWVQSMYQHPILGPKISKMMPIEKYLSQMPQTPEQFQQWKAEQTMGTGEFLKANKPHFTQETSGDRVTQLQTPGLFGGAPQVMRTTYIKESEAQRLIRERQAADAEAGRKVTMRGQNMTDERSRESTAASISKPFEVTGEDGKPVLVRQDKAGNITPVQGYGPKSGADKPLTDAQSKAALFGSRMESANKVLESLATSGTTTSIPGARTGFGVGAGLNVVSSGNQQKLNQAKRDFVNAVLRRESGAVISDAEFDNAEKQYFPQVGDGPEVKAQKLANRQIAIRGVQAEVPKAQRGVLAEIQGQPKAGGVVDFGSLK